MEGFTLYSMDARVGYTQIGPDFLMNMESMLSICQDCTTFHSEDTGVGIRQLYERDLAWVLSSWQVVIDRRPGLCERIKVDTIPYKTRGVFGLRNFVIRDLQETPLFWINSSWVMVNTENMKPDKVPADVAEAYGADAPYEMEYEDRKIKMPEGGSFAPDIQVRPHHLDTNGHVNNVKYVGMALESSGVQESSVRVLRVEYLKQALLGDVIHPRVVRQENSVFVELGSYCIIEFRERINEDG